MRTRTGSSFDSWLQEEGLYGEVTAAAIKRVLSEQIVQAMSDQQLTKAAMARRMHTSRAALERLLDPTNEAVTLHTLTRAAQALGRQVRVELL